MLEWLTFAAAAVGAVGAVLGPYLGYRGVLRTMAQDREAAVADQRQQEVDRYVTYALDDEPAVAAMGVRQLRYLSETGQLSADQSSAVAAALAASLDIPRHRLEQSPTATAVQGGGHIGPEAVRGQLSDLVHVTAAEVQRARLVVSLDDSLEQGTLPALRTIAAAGPPTESGTPGPSD